MWRRTTWLSLEERDEFVFPGDLASGLKGRLRRVDNSISILTASLVLGDLLVMAVVLLIPTHETFANQVLVSAVCVALLVCRGAGRIYRARLRLAYLDDIPRVVVTAGAGSLATTGLLVFLGSGTASVTATAWVVLVLVLLAEIPRGLVLALAGVARRWLGRGERAVVMADGEVGEDLVSTMVAHPEFGLRPVGRLDGGATSDVLAETVRRADAHTVVVAVPRAGSEVVDTVIAAHRLGCSVLVLPALYELFDDRPNVERLRSFPLIRMSGDPTRRTSWQIKRLLDVIVAGLALLVLAPLLAVLAAAVLLALGRPVLFVQERVGRGGRPFRMLKFRTLPVTDESESATTWSVEGDRRLTVLGRLLRSASLDELPQLVNVLRGDMSLVGPRPERPAFVEQFAIKHGGYGARHRVPAGLTGLAQISGLRGDTSITDRARYDNYYIANWSLWLDLRIILLTGAELARHAWTSERRFHLPRPTPRALR